MLDSRVMILACHRSINFPPALNSARSLCAFRRTVTHRAGGSSIGVTMKHCSIPRCSKPSKARGWCNNHYQLWRKWGNPTETRPRVFEAKFCYVAGCGRRHHAHGLCLAHHLRTKRSGLLAPERPIGILPTGSQFTRWKGGITYREGRALVHKPSHPKATKRHKYVKRAVIVIEEYLERYLDPDEIVHHINQNPLDDRLENLQVLTRSQHTRLHHRLRKTKASQQPRNEDGSFKKGDEK